MIARAPAIEKNMYRRRGLEVTVHGNHSERLFNKIYLSTYDSSQAAIVTCNNF